MKLRYSLLVALCASIAACSGSGGDTTTTVGETTTTGSETTTTTGSGDGTSTTGGETTTSEDGTVGTGDDCVIGTWVLDNEAFFEGVFEELAGDESLGIVGVSGLEGEFTTIFTADGTVTAVRTDWGFTMESDQGSIDFVINGEQTGIWEVEGNRLLLTLDDAIGFDIEATMTVDGQEVALPAVPEIPAEALSSSSDFTCDAGTLTVESSGVVSSFTRS